VTAYDVDEEHHIITIGDDEPEADPIEELSAKVDAIAEGLAWLLRNGTRYVPNIGLQTRRAALALADKLEKP
jgi:hypothetical protein